jgi:hypothetical protein
MKLYQITEEDLAQLESDLPRLVPAMMPTMGNAERAILRIQTILSNVRWNYGPPREIEIIDDKDSTP